MRNVIIGHLAVEKDAGQGRERWKRWRPTVALCQQPDLPIARVELLCEQRFEALARQVTADIREVSSETQVCCRPEEYTDPWDFEQVYANLHKFAADYPFNTDEEEYLVHVNTGTHVARICMFLLTESRHLPGRLLQSVAPMRKGDATGSYRIIDLDLSQYDQIASRFRREQKDAVSFLKAGIQTRNKQFNQLIERIEQVAISSRRPLLLTGPTGAGKSSLARRIYELKKTRRLVSGRFVDVNCATLRGDTAMSTLFGHAKGAFTGAVQDRPGLLRAADKGVLFLDEIGELGRDEQAMLLHALESRQFLPVGADREVSSEFQLIAGTNRDLEDDVQAGRFRRDLLSRIKLWTFELPGLCNRSEDIEPNIEYELEEFARTEGLKPRFNKEAKAAFLAFATSAEALWLDNFRDLNGAITRMTGLHFRVLRTTSTRCDRARCPV